MCLFMKKVFLFIFSFFVFSSYFNTTGRCANNEMFYVKKVISGPNKIENLDSQLTFALSCKGTSCNKGEQIYLLFAFLEDISLKDKTTFNVPDGYYSYNFGTVNLKSVGTVPVLVIGPATYIGSIKVFLKLLGTYLKDNISKE